MPEGNELGPFAVEQAHKLLDRLAFQISRTIRRHDAERLHELRVAIRRFSYALLVFKGCFPSKDAKKIRRKLEDLMAPAREVRDCDVALNLLPKLKNGAPRARLGQQRKEAERILIGALRRWIEHKSSLKWRTRLQASSAGKKALPETAQQLASTLLPPLAEKFFETGERAARADSDAGELRRFRASAKKFRYTLELFAPLYDSALNAWLDRIREVHTRAGQMDDIAAAQKTLAAGAALERNFNRQMAEFRTGWPESFGRPAAAERWIPYLQDFPGAKPQRKPMARSHSAGPGLKEIMDGRSRQA